MARDLDADTARLFVAIRSKEAAADDFHRVGEVRLFGGNTMVKTISVREEGGHVISKHLVGHRQPAYHGEEGRL